MAEAKNHRYFTGSLTNTDYSTQATHNWKTISNHIIIVNDGNEKLSFSFNGCDLDGEIFPKDKSLTLSWKLVSRIWLKAESGTPALKYRIFTWVE